MNNRKYKLRLPSDDGPNPYDSKTPIKDTQPRWLWDWKYWVSMAMVGIVWFVIAKLRGSL